MPWIADAKTWEFTYVGPQAVGLLGFPVEDWYDPSFWTDRIHPDDREKAVSTCMTLSDEGGSYEFAYRMLRSDGEVIWVNDLVSVEMGDDGPETLRGFLVDITGQKALAAAVENAQAADRDHRATLAHFSRVATMGELAASIAHELNQPLAAITANAQAASRFLAMTPPDVAEVDDALGDIAGDAKRAASVIRHMRDLLRKGDRREEIVDIVSMVKETVQMLHSDAIARSCSMTVESEPDIPLMSGDPIQLNRSSSTSW